MLIRLASIIGLIATVANTHGWPEPWPSHWHEPNSDVFPGQQIPLAADDNLVITNNNNSLPLADKQIPNS